ncbi:MAG: RIP metalloprotease RseP [Thermodesulfobacteriota bacterium]
MTTILSFILVLGILIFVHELGHFLVAKLFNVKVTKFSLGFGPKMVGKRWGETEYLISALPLGGYVKMVGEQGSEEVSETDVPRAFANKPVWQRFLVVFAGPFSNLFFTFVMFAVIFSIIGLPILRPTTMIGKVMEGGAGEAAGLVSGDQFLRINHQEISDWSEVYHVVTNSAGAPLEITVLRGEEKVTLTAQAEEVDIKNEFGEVTGQGYRLGVERDMSAMEFEDASLVQGVAAGYQQTWEMISMTVIGIGKMIQRVVPASEIGGPILIAQLAGKQMRAGWLEFCYFMGFLSVNLGILNLLPVPVLDGGHLVFFSLEAVRRKPLTAQAMEKLQMIGLALLVALMVFAFYNDIMRMISS